jgi:magnesium-transporting ATPase (P-type)
LLRQDGNLTQNKLTLGDIQPWQGTEPQAVLLAASLASKAEDKDPIDLAVMGGLKDPAALKAYRQAKFVPFDPVSKRTEAEVKDADGNTFFVTKGAPHVIISLAKFGPDEEAKATAIVNALAAKGYRLANHDHRLRRCTGRAQAREVGHAAHSNDLIDPWFPRGRAELWPHVYRRHHLAN